MYYGILKNGDEVVVKIQRPNIENTINTDIEILFSIAKLIDEHFNYKGPFKAVDIVNEFSYTIKKELDFTYEAQNCQISRENLKEDEVIIPKVYWEYTSKRVMVMEKINGTKVSNIEEIHRLGYDVDRLARLGVRVFMNQILIYGIFHGDPHPGNVLIIDNNKIGFIDFGIVGYIDNIILEFLMTLLESGYRKNIDRVVETLDEMGAITEDTDIIELRRDLYYLISYYLNIPMYKLSFSNAFTEILSIAYKHRLKLPSQLILLVKSIVTIEGTGRKLNPKFNLSMILKDVFKDITKEKLKPAKILSNIIDYSKDNLKELKNLPKKANHLLQRAEKNQLKIIIKLEGLQQLENEINIMGNKIALSLLVSAIIVGLSLVIKADVEGPSVFGISVFALIGFLTAGVLGILLVISILLNWIKKGKKLNQ